MKQAISFFIVLSFMFFSCDKKSDKEIEHDYLTSFINDMHLKDNVQWLVISPGLGCHGCIQEGEAFMKDNITNKNILFVLTRIESLKLLQNKIGIELKKQPNIYIDKENKINIPTDNKIYPCIIQLREGKIKNHEFQSPVNAQAFNNLKARISEPL